METNSFDRDFDSMYEKFEEKYNKYPVQMPRSEAFRNAYHDGLITLDQLNAARLYFGYLWHYVGD